MTGWSKHITKVKMTQNVWSYEEKTKMRGETKLSGDVER